MWSSRPLGVLALALGLAGLGCAEASMREMIVPRRYEVPVPPAPTEAEHGAIWSGSTSGGSFLYFDRKARGIGDLVTVVIDEEFTADGEASTDVDSASNIGVDLRSDVGFGELLGSAAQVFFKLFGVTAPDIDPSANINVAEASADNGYAGDGSTSRSSTFTGTVTCRVIEVLPGNLFHVYGRRQITVNHELQLVSVEGFVRREDIGIDNTVPSTVLADSRLSYDGLGVIDDKQRPSLLSRWFDLFYPF